MENKTMERRDFLRLTGMGTAAAFMGGSAMALLSACGDPHDDMAGMDMGGGAVTVIEGDFTTALTIPSTMSGVGTLTAQVTTHTILKGTPSRVLGYQSGSILGPSIEVNSGANINILLQNNLGETSNLHWHGLKTPANMDGHPEDVVPAGASFRYQFPVSQRAGMYWYHAHPHGFTAKQAYLGLAGAFIVRDTEELALTLPSGEFELPLVIQDKRNFPEVSFDYAPTMGEVMTGFMGQYITVNGVNSPSKDVKRSSYRLRVLNGSNARIYNLALSNEAAFSVIGADGGLLATPQSVTSLLLGPGERADLIVNFSTYAVGTELFLVNKLFSAGSAQGKQEFKIIKFRVAESVEVNYSVPITLSVITSMPASSATRNFVISSAAMGSKGMHLINGKIYDKNRIDATVTAGHTEIWEFDNSKGDEPHPMHIHALQFQVLSRTGGRGALIPTETGWKDTVMLMPGETVRTIMTFGQNKGKYVVHCHNLEHEEDGMMLQFEIV